MTAQGPQKYLVIFAPLSQSNPEYCLVFCHADDVIFCLVLTCFCLLLQTGTCALFFSAQGGFLDIVKELLSHGAPVDLPSYVS